MVAGLQLRMLHGLPQPMCQMAVDLSFAAAAEGAALRKASGVPNMFIDLAGNVRYVDVADWCRVEAHHPQARHLLSVKSKRANLSGGLTCGLASGLKECVFACRPPAGCQCVERSGCPEQHVAHL